MRLLIILVCLVAFSFLFKGLLDYDDPRKNTSFKECAICGSYDISIITNDGEVKDFRVSSIRVVNSEDQKIEFTHIDRYVTNCTVYGTKDSIKLQAGNGRK